MSSGSLVCCILLNWNGWKDTLACLASLHDCCDSALSILVVDNGSTDDSVSIIRAEWPRVEILETKQNLGFAGGNNRGIQLALERNFKYIWLLNNDTVVTPETLSALISLAESDPGLGEVGSVLFYMDEPNRIQAWGGGKVNLWAGRSRHWLKAVNRADLDYLTAASVLLPARVFREVGLLDPRYFMYWEDTDLSFRIRAAGWRIGVAPDAVVYHKESASSGKKSPTLDRYMTASGALFLRRFAPLPWLSISIMVSTRAVKRFLKMDWRRGWAVIAGLRDVPPSKEIR